MRTREHRGRTYDASSIVDSEGLHRGVFDIDSTSLEETDGLINEATESTYTDQKEAEEAADAAAKKWIDAVVTGSDRQPTA